MFVDSVQYFFPTRRYAASQDYSTRKKQDRSKH